MKSDLIGKKFPVLDNGHVILLDYMGDDSAIVDAARTCYQKGTCAVSKDEGLIRYLIRHRHCYHPTMEVLTADGWKAWKDCNEYECLLVPDPNTKEFNVERVKIKKFGGMTKDDHNYMKMYTFRNSRMSYMVTWKHCMWFKDRNKSEYKKVAIQNMSHWGHFEPSSEYRMPGCGDANNTCPQMEFIGFFLGDGSWSSSRTISFHLKKKRKIDYLKYLVGTLGLEVSKEINTDKGTVRFYIRTPAFLLGFLSFGEKAATKSFTPSLLSLTPAQIRGLYTGLISSDGSVRECRNDVTFGSESSSLLSLVETLAAYLGIKTTRGKKGKTVCMRNADKTTLQSRDHYHGRMDYEGEVYCATTSTGLLAVRGCRNTFGFICGNSSPTESCQLKFHIKLPIFVERQWARHRTAGWNEVSARYSELPEETYLPLPEDVCQQSKVNNQGRGQEMEEYANEFIAASALNSERCFETYHKDLENGVARELARINLPLSTYTEKVWWCNLHNLLHFLGLRMDSHAQKEIKNYADVIGHEIVSKLFPITWQAYIDYRLEAMQLTRLDIRAITNIQRGADRDMTLEVVFNNKRERQECLDKLNLLGIG